MIRYFIICLLVILTSGCKKGVVFGIYQTVKDENWCRYDIPEFRVNIPEAGRYKVSLCMRHTSDYEMANLWCFMEIRHNAERLRKDTANIKIAESDGRWLGEGGTIKTLEQPLNKEGILLPQGECLFRIEQGMRIECLKGVKNVGLKIEKINE